MTFFLFFSSSLWYANQSSPCLSEVYVLTVSVSPGTWLLPTCACSCSHHCNSSLGRSWLIRVLIFVSSTLVQRTVCFVACIMRVLSLLVLSVAFCSSTTFPWFSSSTIVWGGASDFPSCRYPFPWWLCPVCSLYGVWISASSLFLTLGVPGNIISTIQPSGI